MLWPPVEIHCYCTAIIGKIEPALQSQFVLLQSVVIVDQEFNPVKCLFEASIIDGSLDCKETTTSPRIRRVNAHAASALVEVVRMFSVTGRCGYV
jgi:hypothetical protein